MTCQALILGGRQAVIKETRQNPCPPGADIPRGRDRIHKLINQNVCVLVRGVREKIKAGKGDGEAWGWGKVWKEKENLTWGGRDGLSRKLEGRK